MKAIIEILLCGMLLLAAATAGAAPSLALGYTPKYPPGLSHFDYANPDAPKGGTLTLPAVGSFDSLNPFLLKGLPAAGLGDLVFETLMERSPWTSPSASTACSRKTRGWRPTGCRSPTG